VLYEIPLMAMGLAGHVLVVRSVPALSALPGPAQVGLAVLPTALIAANGLWLAERLPPRVERVYGLVAVALYLGLSLSLPGKLVLATVRGELPLGQMVLSVLGALLLLLPSLLFSGLYLDSVARAWREPGADTPR
jgi:hypothetical protein